MSSLGQKIRSLRKERKMTQQELAEGLVTASMVSQIESDKATPSQQLLEQLAARLGVKPSYFADDMSYKTDLMQTYRRAKQFLDGENYASALPLFITLTNPVRPQFRAELLYADLALCYERLGRYEDAVGANEEVVCAALEKQDIPTAIHAYYRLGQMERKIQNIGLARMYWERACELLLRHPDLAMPLAMRIHANLARILMQLRDYRCALDNYERAAVLAEKFSAQLDLAVILHGMGVVLLELGEYDAARDKFDEAIQRYEAIQNQRGINQCHVNFGVALRRAGKYAQAVDQLTWCINHPEIQADPIRLANAFSERALCCSAQGDLDRAEEDALNALQFDKDTPEIQAYARKTLAVVAMRRGAYKDALEWVNQALDYVRRVGDVSLAAELYTTRARILWQLGDAASANETTIQLAKLAVANTPEHFL